MKDFDKKLKRLQEISEIIKDNDVELEDASKLFEEGISLAQGLEKQLDNLENKVEILITNSDSDEDPEFTDFNN